MLSSSGSTVATIAAYESKAIGRWFVAVGGEQTTGAGAKIGADQIVYRFDNYGGLDGLHLHDEPVHHHSEEKCRCG